MQNWMTMIEFENYTGIAQPVAVFGMYLVDYLSDYNHIQVITADMAANASLERFKMLYPDHFLDVGIAEQNMIGIASGLAEEGFLPIAVAQASFISMRSFEMIRQYLGYMHYNVKIVGLNSGFLLQYMGNTHYCIEDLSLMRNINDMIVLSPSDGISAVLAMDAAIKHQGPVYVRMTGNTQLKPVYQKAFEFKIGKNIELKKGGDIAIFATGSMVSIALQVATLLEDCGISARVVDVHTIKPLDTDSICQSKKAKLIVSVEEHSIIGGLGSAISEYIASEGGFPKLVKLGIEDQLSSPGDYGYLLDQHRLTVEYIKKDILKSYNDV